MRLARALVQARAAACVNVVPAVTSLFWWQGKIDQAREVLLVIKTASRKMTALTVLVRRLHPYEVPEIIALPIQRGFPPYLRWIQDSLRR